MNDIRLPIRTECTECPVGIASGTTAGTACRFSDEQFLRDQHIYAEGEPGHHAWYIKSGTVILRRKTHNTGDGDGRVTAIRFEGSLLGLELLVGDTYTDTAVAGPDTVLCRIERDDLDDWLGPAHLPARTALELVLRTEESQLTRTRQLEGTAAQRLASWLSGEARRRTSVVLRRRELAELLGMRAETLSRVLTRFHELGLIEVTRSHLRLLRRDALTRVADGERLDHAATA